MNVKIWVAISFIVNLIFGVFLLVWKDDNSKTAAINATDKIINAIIQILVLLKGHFCFKEKLSEKNTDNYMYINYNELFKDKTDK